MADISPAAQAVLDAWYAKLNPDPDGLTYLTHDPEREALAAALRAAADQVLPAASRRDRASWSPFAGQIRSQLLVIADELDAQP